MKRLLVILGIALASAALTYVWVDLTQSIDRPDRAGSDLEWIRVEFDLTAEQFAAVRQLHAEYAGVCERHCADIVAARSRVAAVPQTAGASVERSAAQRDVTKLEAVCNEATRAHLRRVAAVMSPAQGERFLRMVEPHLAQLPHNGTRSLGR